MTLKSVKWTTRGGLVVTYRTSAGLERAASILPDGIVTVAEAAHALHCSTIYLYRLIKSKAIKTRTAGRLVVIPMPEVKRLSVELGGPVVARATAPRRRSA